MKTILKNAGNFKDDIVIEDGKIVHIGKTSEPGIDLGGDFVFPGLIDIHSHGCIGYDTMDGNYLGEIAEFEAKNGITTWYPTTMTMSIDKIKSVVNPEIPRFENAANIAGFHMEGPYISPKYKGAQNEKYIKSPVMAEFNEFNNIKMVTLAPELDGSIDFIKECPAVVSLGHTAADYETAAAAMDAGAMCLTHTFNAMPPLHHRNPGPIGAAIEKNIYAQVICDGLHIHKSVIQMLYRTFGADRMVLISDSMRATGMPDGEYEFGGQKITVTNKVARTKDGAIAGSTSTLFTCVKKAVEFGIPMRDAFKMASETPAKLMKLNKGRIAEGFDADIITVSKNLDLTRVFINGTPIKL